MAGFDGDPIPGLPPPPMLPPPEAGDPLAGGDPFIGGEESAFPCDLLQLLRCTTNLSGKKVRAQLGHASNTLSFQSFRAWSLY
jgi:hypothetical protein